MRSRLAAPVLADLTCGHVVPCTIDIIQNVEDVFSLLFLFYLLLLFLLSSSLLNLIRTFSYSGH